MMRDDILAFKDRGYFSEKEFSTTLGLVQVGSRICVRRLLGENYSHGMGSVCECYSFSWLDHPVAYRYAFSPEDSIDVLAWCPYWTWEEHKGDRAEGYAGMDVFEFAREHGLHIEEFPHGSGWYACTLCLWCGGETKNEGAYTYLSGRPYLHSRG